MGDGRREEGLQGGPRQVRPGPRDVPHGRRRRLLQGRPVQQGRVPPRRGLRQEGVEHHQGHPPRQGRRPRRRPLPPEGDRVRVLQRLRYRQPPVPRRRREVQPGQRQRELSAQLERRQQKTRTKPRRGGVRATTTTHTCFFNKPHHTFHQNSNKTGGTCYTTRECAHPWTLP